MSRRMTIERALEALRHGADPAYAVLLEHASLQIGFYQPRGSDPQKPHAQDEVYVIAAGTGFFVNGDSRRPFEPGEVLFVPAGRVHRFEDFSDDFAAWVVFYGPEGGERRTSTGDQTGPEDGEAT